MVKYRSLLVILLFILLGLNIIAKENENQEQENFKEMTLVKFNQMEHNTKSESLLGSYKSVGSLQLE